MLAGRENDLAQSTAGRSYVSVVPESGTHDWNAIVKEGASRQRDKLLAMPLDFTGKKAAVTGGANGIGLATARALASGGAEVWIFDLEPEQPAEVAASFGG